MTGFSQIVTGTDSESAGGFLPRTYDASGDPIELSDVLVSLHPSFSTARQEEESFRGYLKGYGGSTFFRWMDVFESLVGDSVTYDPERVSFRGEGKDQPEYEFSIGLLKYSAAKDEHSLDDVFFEVNNTDARAGARARFRSDGSIYNPETIAAQNPKGASPTNLGVREDLERSLRFSQFKLELYDLLFPENEAYVKEE